MKNMDHFIGQAWQYVYLDKLVKGRTDWKGDWMVL